MDRGFQRGFSIANRVDSLHTLEAFIENICDTYNIFDFSFGNILMAATEMYQIARHKMPDLSPSVYAQKRSGTLIIGFHLDELFLDVAGLFQKDLWGLVDKPTLNFSEKCVVNVKTNSDQVLLDQKNGAIELCFYISSINSQQTKLRLKILDSYFECVNDRMSAKRNV
jgi:hypothetical protein